MSLFSQRGKPPQPLAERMRPTALDQVLGQAEVKNLLEAFIEQESMPSLVFWGPPGSGKTSLSRLMAALLGWEGRTLNATSASVKDIRELAEEAKYTWANLEKRTLLFIDEIHRLNKGQQDVLLPIVEAGTLTLAGSTTENPYFSINKALRSRVQLIQLQPMTATDVKTGLARAKAMLDLEVEDGVFEWIAVRAAGDLRLAYTVLESASLVARTRDRAVVVDDVSLCLKQTQISGDRKGDNHYDLASAYQKSLRGSDVNAAVYYLARFIETGEDPRFIARRLLVTASEDVGNADPQAFLVAGQAFRAVEALGMPEAKIPLSQATLYVARAPKSNESIAALGKATALLQERPLDPIPKHLRDSHYPGAKDLGHGKDYLYTHNHPEQSQKFLPKEIEGEHFVEDGPSREPRIEEADAQWLMAFLAKNFGHEQWFDVDIEPILNASGWSRGKVRSALNYLVQSQKLAFKRCFKLPKQ